MGRTVTLRHADGRVVTLETAMDDAFLERMYPEWRVDNGQRNGDLSARSRNIPAVPAPQGQMI